MLVPHIDAVLPLTEKDCARANTLLLPTIRAYLPSLGKLWIVTPPKQMINIQDTIADSSVGFIAETDILPELSRMRKIRGWNLQQVLKLSMARIVDTSFYLVLDADVVVGRAVQYAELVQNGRGIVRIDLDHHPHWYVEAEQVLGLNRSGRSHGVTPAVFARDGVMDLFAYLSRRYQCDAESALLDNIPWTEHTLYHTFLEAIGSFDRFHVAEEWALYDNCIWVKESSTDWDAAQTFSLEAKPFSVLQSNATDSIDPLVAKIREHFKITGCPSPI